MNSPSRPVLPRLAIAILAAISPTLAQDGQADKAPAKDAAMSAAATAWPSFHGRNACGVATGFKTPKKWNIETGENIVWKTPLPGMSHASPIVWGDRIFLANAVKVGAGQAALKVGLYGSVKPVPDEGPHKMQLHCIDRVSGKILWTKTAFEGVPKIKRHPKGSHAASTPATDGVHVAVFFGTEGLYVYDNNGKQLWKKDLGVLDSGWSRSPSDQWGFGSSPVIHDGKLFVQCDIQQGSFVAAFDVATGKQLWRTERDEIPGWGTPTVDTSTDRHQLILNGYKHIGGYALDTGKELWKLAGGGDIPVPTPVVSHGLVFITSAHGRSSPILAISTAATGTFTMDADASEHVAWNIPRGGNYMQTPFVYGDNLYCCRDSGVLTCLDAKTGEQHYKKRLSNEPNGFTASGVAADDKLYFSSEEGDIHVLITGNGFELLAVNSMGETCMATPAISRGTLYFRLRSQLVAVANLPVKKPK